jgi:hypothetical protein
MLRPQIKDVFHQWTSYKHKDLRLKYPYHYLLFMKYNSLFIIVDALQEHGILMVNSNAFAMHPYDFFSFFTFKCFH